MADKDADRSVLLVEALSLISNMLRAITSGANPEARSSAGLYRLDQIVDVFRDDLGRGHG